MPKDLTIILLALWCFSILCIKCWTTRKKDSGESCSWHDTLTDITIPTVPGVVTYFLASPHLDPLIVSVISSVVGHLFSRSFIAAHLLDGIRICKPTFTKRKEDNNGH